MVMLDPIQQQQAMQLQQLQQSQNNGQNIGNVIGGLVGAALAKRNDGINDSIGNGIRYTNDGSNGAFNDAQLKSLQQFVGNGMDMGQAYGGLANQKFTINGQQFQANKDGLLSPIARTQQVLPQSVNDAGLINSVPIGASIIGLSPDQASLKAGMDWGKNAITIE